MRGATMTSYVVPRILCDFICCLLFFEALWFTNAIYGLNTQGWQLLGLSWAAAQSFYQATINTAAINSKAGIVIKAIAMV